MIARKHVQFKLEEMKKLILILFAAVAMSCGDGSNRASEAGSESQDNYQDNYSDDAFEADTTDVRTDTTSNMGPGVGAQGQIDTTSTIP